MIKAEMQFKMNIPDLDFTETLENISGRFVKAIQKYMDAEVSINEVGYAPLSPKYQEWKRKKGLSPLILHATNQLRNSFPKETIEKNKVAIYSRRLTANGRNLGDILMNQGTSSGRKFNFFGVNTRMEADAIKIMEKAIAEAIKNA